MIVSFDIGMWFQMYLGQCAEDDVELQHDDFGTLHAPFWHHHKYIQEKIPNINTDEEVTMDR